MKKLARTVLMMALAAILVAPLMAQDEKKKKRKKGKKRARVATQDRFLQRIRSTLTDEQKKKIAGIRKEFGPKFQAINKKRREIITPEKQRAAFAAAQKARKDGKNRREVSKVYQDALGLDAEAKKKNRAISAEQRKLFVAYRAKISECLTDEQKAKLRQPQKKSKKRKKKKDTDK